MIRMNDTSENSILGNITYNVLTHLYNRNKAVEECSSDVYFSVFVCLKVYILMFIIHSNIKKISMLQAHSFYTRNSYRIIQSSKCM